MLLIIVFVVHVSYPGRMIVGSIGLIVHDGIMSLWRHVIAVPRTRNKPDIKSVDVPGIVGVVIVIVVMKVQPAYPRYLSEMVITDKHISGLSNSTVVIVIHRYAFNLDHCAVIIILHIGIVIISGIEAYVHAWGSDVYAESAWIVIEVELPVGIDGKFNVAFHKNEWISITVCAQSFGSFRGGQG